MDTRLNKLMAAIAITIILTACGSAGTGSIGSFDPNHITGEQIQRTCQPNVLMALQGLVPGLLIQSNGFEATATIRGKNSLMLDNSPLFIVDGIQVSSLDMLNPYDIDYIQVLKDASIYGVRGANGAIVVYTKKLPDTPAKERQVP
jgi:TonB-dependent SusC/RagA subfamily outer membrane receptor